MRIDKISIRNFKAFHGTTNIDVNGKNLLVYGENGSGKSSLAEGLRAIFTTSGSMHSILGASPVNVFLSEGAHAKIEVSTVDGYGCTESSELEFYGRTFEGSRSRGITDAAKINGFITYKQLLEVYFLPSDKYQLNLYELIVKNLLILNINPLTNNSFNLDYIGILANMPKINRGNALVGIELLLRQFSGGIKEVLKELKGKANELLKYFDYKIEIEEFIFSGLTHDKPGHCIAKSSENIELRIKYCGESIDDYSNILNEARLTALAICIYLASIKTVPEPELKVLILDDIMIGLDMGNRQPIVEILKNEFSDWQIFFMTHDRSWFEKLKKHSFVENWMTAEMYADNSGRFPKPVIIQPSLSNIEKSKKYFSSHDYPAAANYLRKAFEEFLFDFLPENLRSISNSNGTIEKDTGLDSLWTKFHKLIKEFSFNNKSEYLKRLKKFSEIKALVLNPLSHHDLESQIYAGEVKSAIEFYEFVSSFSLELKLSANDSISLVIPDSSGNDYRYNFLSKDHLHSLKFRNQVCGSSKQILEPVNYFDSNYTEHSLGGQGKGHFKQLLTKIIHFLKIEFRPRLYENFMIGEKPIIELFELTFFSWLKNESVTNPVYKDLYSGIITHSRGYPELEPAPVHSNSYKEWLHHLKKARAEQCGKEVLREAFKDYYSLIKSAL